MKYSYKTTKDNRGCMTVTATGKSVLGNTFVGRAVCAPEDHFDFSLGSAIARRRANIKRLTYMLENQKTAVLKAYDAVGKARERLIKRSDELEWERAALDVLLITQEE